ncbi:MAG: hypothetical protein MZV64_31435 [Ignavibacteriales bacterium]|nr:hypothetical protein [Ignavibacteriales bacterium]
MPVKHDDVPQSNHAVRGSRLPQSRSSCTSSISASSRPSGVQLPALSPGAAAHPPAERSDCRQWILLVLRTLLLLVLVLTFSRPALRGPCVLRGDLCRSSIVLLIDDSPSMARNAGGVLFDQSRAAAAVSLDLRDRVTRSS